MFCNVFTHVCLFTLASAFEGSGFVFRGWGSAFGGRGTAFGGRDLPSNGGDLPSKGGRGGGVSVLVRKCFIKHMCFNVLYFHGHAFFCWKLPKSALLCFIFGKMCFIFEFLFENNKIGEF